jgi:predicted kinase
MATYAVAKDNLEIGHVVVADSANLIALTRNA